MLLLLIGSSLVYIGGYIGQFWINYKIWKTYGGVIGDSTSPELPSINVFKCIVSFFTKEGILCAFILGTAITVFVLLSMNSEKLRSEQYDDRNFTYSDKGTYGTAGYMSKKEIQNILNIENIKNTDGTILGLIDNKVISVPVKTNMNKNIAVYGASGSMKSRAFVRNMILQAVKRGESIICTDPKGELTEDMQLYLRNNGYTVKIFNLVSPKNSDSWNCISEIEGDEIMAQICADVIIKNTSSGKSDHFWDSSELNLLKALILYIDCERKDEYKSLGEAYKMISNLTEKELEERFEVLPNGHPAKAPYNIFKQAGEKVRGGVIVGLGSRLQVFQNELIRNITAYNEIDLSLPGKEKAAYFCISSDQDSTFDFLSSLFFSFLFIKLIRYADFNGIDGKLPVAVNFVLDEMPNIGAIPDFKKKISTVRSRNVSVSVIFQNIAQLKNRYPNDEWQEILGNCDTQIALGCTDPMTAKYISDRAGETTINVSSTGKQLTSIRISDYTPEYRETSSVGKRKLMTPDEVLRMPMDTALIIIRGQNVFKVKKFDYSLHPESKKLRKMKATEHIPKWRENKNSERTDAKQKTENSEMLRGDNKIGHEICMTQKTENRADKDFENLSNKAKITINDLIADDVKEIDKSKILGGMKNGKQRN